MKRSATMGALAISMCSAVLFYQYLYRPQEPKGSADQSTIAFLQEYIRINTSHPKPTYDRALNFLKQHAQSDGFAYQEIPLPSGKKVAIITYQGTDSNLPTLVLNHHMDVVPASTEGWTQPPFAGALYQQDIIGRGAQDMKGIAAVHYCALRELKHSGLRPQRTIHIFAVPDEEIGGFTGTKQFVQTDVFKKLNVGFVIDEGHASGDNHFLDIKIAERKPIQIRITSRGNAAHGSHLLNHNAIHDLVEFLHEIVHKHHVQQKRVTMHRQAGECLSYNITSLTAGIRKQDESITLNMIPKNAQATIDIRVPPAYSCAEILKNLMKRLSKYPKLTVDVLAQATEEPPVPTTSTILYKTLSETISAHGLQARRHFFEASSDLRFYQARGIDGVGFTPFTVPDNVHGTNESIPVDQLIRGKNIMVQFLKNFCCV